MTDFQRELGSLINKHSMGNGSDTPDFILAQYLAGCLKTFDNATKARDSWYGVNLFPGCGAGRSKEREDAHPTP